MTPISRQIYGHVGSCPHIWFSLDSSVTYAPILGYSDIHTHVMVKLGSCYFLLSYECVKCDNQMWKNVSTVPVNSQVSPVFISEIYTSMSGMSTIWLVVVYITGGTIFISYAAFEYHYGMSLILWTSILLFLPIIKVIWSLICCLFCLSWWYATM